MSKSMIYMIAILLLWLLLILPYRYTQQSKKSARGVGPSTGKAVKGGGGSSGGAGATRKW